MNEPTTFSNIPLLFVVVIVLYQTAPEDSVAFATFSSLMAQQIIPPEEIHCVIYDNGPAFQQIPVQSFAVTYHHAATNPGLAAAYEFALRLALQKGATWLLLLDQDTHLTHVYLNELVQQAKMYATDSRIKAVAPKLMQGDWLLSPHWPYSHPRGLSLRDQHGPIELPLQVFNSGALLRVSALSAIGGFPQQFPLDYLDHAVFKQLQQKGGRVYLLQAELQHNLASTQLNLVRDFSRSTRLQSIHRAESRFYKTYGSLQDRFDFALRRSRLIVRMIVAGNISGAALLLRFTLRP